MKWRRSRKEGEREEGRSREGNRQGEEGETAGEKCRLILYDLGGRGHVHYGGTEGRRC